MTQTRPSDDSIELYCATCERPFDRGELCPNDGTRLIRLIAAQDPLIGREIDGRFTILERLGHGGMGAVYRARQHSMGREVAIKVLPTDLVSDATSIKRFLREAKLASRLTHPNIVSVLDFGQTRDGVFYLVMELVAGETLQALLTREHRLELARVMRIGLQLCDALDGAHALPIVHRDLKPSNVMVLAHGRDHVKVLDFGLAKSLSLDATTAGSTTSAGVLLGTPMFMPPEVANGRAADARADLYSLGCMLYMMGSGQPPFVTDSVLGLIAMHGTLRPAPMSGVPAPVAAVVDRLLEKHPDRRYQTAIEARVALEDAYLAARASLPNVALTDPAGQRVAAVPTALSGYETGAAPASKLPWLLVALGGITLAAGAAVVGFIVSTDHVSGGGSSIAPGAARGAPASTAAPTGPAVTSAPPPAPVAPPPQTPAAPDLPAVRSGSAAPPAVASPAPAAPAATEDDASAEVETARAAEPADKHAPSRRKPRSSRTGAATSSPRPDAGADDGDEQPTRARPGTGSSSPF